MKTLPALLVLVLSISQVHAETPDELARAIYAELIGIDTTQKGSTTVAAEAMAKRLREAGLPAKQLELIEPFPARGNLVARIKGNGSRRPLLLLAHLDVVDAAASEWTVPAFELTEKDGYFYGRGTMDDKAMAAILVANMIGQVRAGWVPDRDVILALTADEETGNHNGVKWLMENRPDIRAAELALNEEGRGSIVDGRHISNKLQFSEKVYQSYHVEATGPGGHSSLPTRDNPINRVAAGLSRIAVFEFPLDLSEGTRAYFRANAEIRLGVEAADMRALLETPPDPVAIQRLSDSPVFNAVMRTTCVATQIQGGHAENALPMRATATINCRILPHESVDSVTKTLARVLADDNLTIHPVEVANLSPPSPLQPAIMEPMTRITAAMWSGARVIPIMGVGASDSVFTRSAGIATYGTQGLFMTDEDEHRMHGKDERLLVRSFYEGREFLDRLVTALADPRE